MTGYLPGSCDGRGPCRTGSAGTSPSCLGMFCAVDEENSGDGCDESGRRKLRNEANKHHPRCTDTRCGRVSFDGSDGGSASLALHSGGHGRRDAGRSCCFPLARVHVTARLPYWAAVAVAHVGPLQREALKLLLLPRSILSFPPPPTFSTAENHHYHQSLKPFFNS